MGSVCSKSNMAVAPVPFNTTATTTNDAPDAEWKTGINIIWLGENNIPCLSTLRQKYGQVHVFKNLDDSIKMINSLSLPKCNCIYVIYGNFENHETLKTMINKINDLNKICAIYIYYEDKNILLSYPSICTASNENHLANQINMVTKYLGALPIIDGSIANTVNFDGEDMRLEVHENTFNALLNSIEESKFTVTDEQVNKSYSNIGKKDKNKNITWAWAVDFVVSNMNISLKESNADASNNTVNITFTATGKATITSTTIPLYITNCPIEPGISKTSAVKGDAVIMFNSENNTFEIKVLKAIVASIDFTVFEFKDRDITEYLSSFNLPGPLNLSQTIPIANDYITTTDGSKTTEVFIVDFKIRCRNKRIILSLKLDYRKHHQTKLYLKSSD